MIEHANRQQWVTDPVLLAPKVMKWWDLLAAGGLSQREAEVVVARFSAMKGIRQDVLEMAMHLVLLEIEVDEEEARQRMLAALDLEADALFRRYEQEE